MCSLKDIKSGYLMLEDTTVLYFHLDDFVIEIYHPELLPYALRDKLTQSSILKQVHDIEVWLSGRVISMTIGNYKQLAVYFNLVQTSSIEYKVKVVMNCRAVSTNDAYWIRYENDTDINWDKVNIYHNNFRNIVSISLSDTIPSVTGELDNPNINMTGTFPKTWLRCNDTLYLIKAGKTTDGINASVEVLASDFLECVKGSFDFVRYKKLLVDDKVCSVCESYVKDGYSVVTAFESLPIEKFKIPISNMIVIDYLLVNTDRHMDNYAFYMSNKTGLIEQCTPLYDFNYSFIADLLNKSIDDTICQVFNDGHSIIEIVKEYARFSDIIIDKESFERFKIKCNYPQVISGLSHRINVIEEITKRKLLV